MIYLDNAATTGYKPPQVISAVADALQNLSANPGRSGHKLSTKAMGTMGHLALMAQRKLPP